MEYWAVLSTVHVEIKAPNVTTAPPAWLIVSEGLMQQREGVRTYIGLWANSRGKTPCKVAADVIANIIFIRH